MTPQPARKWTGFAGAQTVQLGVAQLVSSRNEPLNQMAFYLGMATVFLQFSVLPQVTGYIFQTNLYLLYVIALPAQLAMIVSGGFRRCFRARPAHYWTAFGCWMWLICPFSSWRSTAVVSTYAYWRSNLIMLFIMGAMLSEWSDIRKVMNVIATSAVVNVLCARFLRIDMGGRMGVALGTIGNPNDYAAHLLLVLPFLFWVVTAGKIVVSRIVALGCVCAGLYLVLATSSRGALLALAFDAVFWLLMGTGRQKAALVLLGPVAAMLLLATVPAASLRRLTEVWSGSVNNAESKEAMESSQARQYTLRTSIRYTFEHPLFGVGPAQFPLYEGMHEKVIGTHGYWHETHNSFTQASSECGIPGFIFFAGGTLSTLLLLLKTLRQASRRPGCEDIRAAVFYITLGMVGFTVAITFLNFAYFFYLPAMGGLAVGVWVAAQREFERREAPLNAGPA
ncbi:MAG TPA: O-antigen ligase family protein [Bryobacteraceae bacterium]|nr:O-antigen ligase family protein [Bryobacteraceae bacterium]